MCSVRGRGLLRVLLESPALPGDVQSRFARRPRHVRHDRAHSGLVAASERGGACGVAHSGLVGGHGAGVPGAGRALLVDIHRAGVGRRRVGLSSRRAPVQCRVRQRPRPLRPELSMGPFYVTRPNPTQPNPTHGQL